MFAASGSVPEGTWEADVPSVPPDETEVSTAPPTPRQIVEAFLFVGGPALTAERAAEAVRGLSEVHFREIVAELHSDYRRQGRPYAVLAKEGGFVLALRPRFRPVLERLHGTTREARLSQAAVDVLALVAYRQPATRGEVDSLRGIDSAAVLRQLVRHGLIAQVRRAEAGQREVAYGTTPRFLELFQLRSLDDLPRTEDLQKL
jgi:segregation and condensation protein B